MLAAVPMPSDIGIIDLMMSLPITDPERIYGFLKEAARDKASREEFRFPAEYMFKDVPDDRGKDADPVAVTLAEMDRWGVERSMMGLATDDTKRAFAEHPNRFIPSLHVDPNGGMETVRQIAQAHEKHGIKAVTSFPAGTSPQVAINDKRYYPIYAKCVELGLPIFINAGVPGPRVPMHCQHVEHLDEVCWFFPELTVVTMHGCEPWEDLAVKLMLKWPNLHYATSAFAPKYYPEAVIRYANTRGADKILYAGYFPMGLTLERIMTEMRDVPFRDHVWPKFLRENAIRVLKLEV
jgi:predicted TIM-barrel fold metal-dependent hydrolase